MGSFKRKEKLPRIRITADKKKLCIKLGLMPEEVGGE
jgi:hypothetical protein